MKIYRSNRKKVYKKRKKIIYRQCDTKLYEKKKLSFFRRRSGSRKYKRGHTKFHDNICAMFSDEMLDQLVKYVWSHDVNERYEICGLIVNARNICAYIESHSPSSKNMGSITNISGSDEYISKKQFLRIYNSTDPGQHILGISVE